MKDREPLVRKKNSNLATNLKYNPKRHPKLGYEFCREFGLQDEQLAQLFDIHRRTLLTWKKEYPEFKEALRNGKDDYDSTHVEKSLLRRALGYSYEEVSIEEKLLKQKKKGGDTVTATPVITKRTTVKQVAPDVVAMIFYLKNRQPERWRDVHRTEGSVKVDHNHKGKVKIDDSHERAEEVARILIKSGAIQSVFGKGVTTKTN